MYQHYIHNYKFLYHILLDNRILHPQRLYLRPTNMSSTPYRFEERMDSTLFYGSPCK